MSAFGTFETCRMRRAMSEFEGKAENICSHRVLLSLTQLGHRPISQRDVPEAAQRPNQSAIVEP